MVEGGYPSDASQRRAFSWIERKTVADASRCVFTTGGTLRLYAERYPLVTRRRLAIVPNGYDEGSFKAAERVHQEPTGSASRPLVLLHSGTLYPSERDPKSFFTALVALLQRGRIGSERVKIILRAPGFEQQHRRLVEDLGLQGIVLIEPPISHRDAIKEMLAADGLIVLQASNCNNQVPAKVYEYLRARRPILALTDPVGDTAGVLRSAGIRAIASLTDPGEIARVLDLFVEDIRAGTATLPDEHEIVKHSRRAQTAALADIFDDVIEESVHDRKLSSHGTR
jgi:glycosyltransferase involved in cell wall biosynthesis